MKGNALGRGLDALLSGDELKIPLEQLSRGTANPTRISLAGIEANPWQPRTVFDENALAELTESIRTHGVLQPLLVREKTDGRGYYLVAGERRFRACREAGLDEVPCIVLEVDDIQSLAIALTENIQRADLDPIEEATGYRTLQEKFGLKQDEIAQRVGKPRSSIANLMRLLSLPADVQNAIRTRAISMGHARAIAGLDSSAVMVRALDTVVRRQLNVRQTEQLCREIDGYRKSRKPEDEPTGLATDRLRDPNVEALERAIASALGARVRLRPRSDVSGTIEIEYMDLDHLDAFLRLIGVDFEA